MRFLREGVKEMEFEIDEDGNRYVEFNGKRLKVV